MVVHFSRKKSIATRINGIGKQKSSRTSANCHFRYAAFRIESVVHETIHVERLLYSVQKFTGTDKRRKKSHHAAPAFGIFGEQKAFDFRAELFGNFIVHSAACIIKIRMCGIHCDMVFNSLDNAAFHCVASGNALQPVEKQRVMRHNEIRPAGNGFINHRLGYIQTQ